MTPYSIEVALFDYLPVALTAVALALLARGISARHRPLAGVATLAAVLVSLGGACKASWKLIIASGGPALPWLENLLFILMAPGFAAMAFSLHHARRAWQWGEIPNAHGRSRLALWMALPLALAASLALALPGSRAWFFALLAATTLANWTLLAQAGLAARKGGFGGRVIPLLVLNFIATLLLSRLSRLPPGESSAWIQEGVNLVAQAALALAFWQLGRRMQEKT